MTRILDLGQNDKYDVPGYDPDCWDHINESIDKFFPMPSYRDGQKEATEEIVKAFKKGTKFVLAECPTGSGKSAIAYAVSQFFDKTYWITIQKALQDQLAGDFGSDGKHVKNSHVLVDLKGRNAYPCNYWDRYLELKGQFLSKAEKSEYAKLAREEPGCDVGHCKREGKAKAGFCFPDTDKPQPEGLFSYCPYWQRKTEAIISDVCLMNFSSFLFQTIAVRDFSPRKLLIIDEAHNTESELLKFIELRVVDRYFRVRGIRFPRLKDAAAYADYFEKIDIEDLIMDRIKVAQMEPNPKEESEWKNVLLKYSTFIKSAKSGNWIVEFKERNSPSGENLWNTVTLKPIYINKFANDYLFSMADHVLMLSATILSPKIMCSGLGIDQKESFAYRMKNRFPVENRQIIFSPVGSLSYKNKAATFPKLVKKVNKICKEHKDQKGIIHTHNFEIAELLISECNKNVSSRFLFQRDFDTKYDMLNHHKTTKDSIIVAPAMHEGIDLIDDFSRFQIICKVPYPSMGDPQIKARMDIEPQFYDWLTAQKLVQSYGRSVRSVDDWATTYILDKDYERFSSKASGVLPGWFKEAIIR